jgi:hypothetical protein
MKDIIGRKLLMATLFTASITSFAGCYYYDRSRDYEHDRDYAYGDRYRDNYYWRNHYTRDDLENRHVVRDYRFGDRNYGED